MGTYAWARHKDAGHRVLNRREAWPLILLGGWLAVSVLRAGDRWDTAVAATMLAALSAAAPLALARVSATEPPPQQVVLVMGAAAVGSAAAAWVVPIVLGTGIQWRQALPIGGASNSAVGLTLALAGTLTGARLWPDQRWIWRAGSLVAGLLLVQSLSRAGWILALVLVIVAMVRHHRWKISWGVPAVGLVAVATVLELVRRRGSGLLFDHSRWANAASGLEAMTGSWDSVVFGLGPMRLWPWLALERGRPGTELGSGNYYNSPWGTVLYHAHSTYLEVVVEYGPVGLLLFIAVLAVVVSRCVREIRQRGALSLLAVAVLLALPAMLVELYLLRGFPSAVLFWTAVFAVGGGGGRPRGATSARWHVRRNRGCLI